MIENESTKVSSPDKINYDFAHVIVLLPLRREV